MLLPTFVNAKHEVAFGGTVASATPTTTVFGQRYGSRLCSSQASSRHEPTIVPCGGNAPAAPLGGRAGAPAIATVCFATLFCPEAEIAWTPTTYEPTCEKTAPALPLSHF